MYSPSEIALQKLQTLGEVYHPGTAKDVCKKENYKYVYLVYNGSNVLQLGSGAYERIKKCMRGGLAGKHNKAFICAIGELVLGQPNAYAYVLLPSNRVKDEERELHRCLGVETNKDGATLIAGIEGRSILEIHQALWMRVKDTTLYRKLDSIEKQMAEELFELVTYATTKIQRTNKIVSSRQGDNLEGNILKKIDKNYLIDVFIKLTNGYLRYRKHRMDPQEFEDFKRSYSPYISHGKPFEIRG